MRAGLPETGAWAVGRGPEPPGNNSGSRLRSGDLLNREDLRLQCRDVQAVESAEGGQRGLTDGHTTGQHPGRGHASGRVCFYADGAHLSVGQAMAS